jgi:hypothetical protein
MLAGFPPLTGPLKLLAAVRLGGMLEWARLLLMPAQALGHELFRADGARRVALRRGGARRRGPGRRGQRDRRRPSQHHGPCGGLAEPEGGAAGLADALGRVSAGARGPDAHPRAGGEDRHRARAGRRGGARGRRAPRGLPGHRRRQPARAARTGGRGRWRVAMRPALRRYRYGPAHAQARLGPVGARARGPRRRCARRHRPRRRRRAGAARCARVIPGAASRAPMLLFGQQSVADPTRAPAGQHTAWAYTHGPRRPTGRGRPSATPSASRPRSKRFAPASAT